MSARPPLSDDLSAEEARIRADERGKLSRELHDTVGQAFVVLSMDAERLVRHADRGSETVRPLAEALASQLQSTIGLVRTTQSSWRASSEGASPPESFARMVAQHVEAATRAGRLSPSIEVAVDDRQLDPARARAAAKALSAALDNVVRHARAARVHVRATLGPRGLVVAVEDDGIGFDPKTAETPTSTGLLSMRARTAAHGGEVTVERRREGGTRVVLTFPAAPRPEEF